MKRLKGNKIYFPKGRSEWTGTTEQKQTLKLTITSGGGMGGSQWRRFVKPQVIKEGLNWLEQLNGTEICINANYIVEIEKVNVITADYICTNHNFNMYNELCTVKVYTTYELEDISFVSEYKLMDEWTYR